VDTWDRRGYKHQLNVSAEQIQVQRHDLLVEIELEFQDTIRDFGKSVDDLGFELSNVDNVVVKVLESGRDFDAAVSENAESLDLVESLGSEREFVGDLDADLFHFFVQHRRLCKSSQPVRPRQQSLTNIIQRL
jgi:hypothetical protein